MDFSDGNERSPKKSKNEHLPNPDIDPSVSTDIEIDTPTPDPETSTSHETPCFEIDTVSPSMSTQSSLLDLKTETKASLQSQQTNKQLITEIDKNQQVYHKIDMGKVQPKDNTINSGSTSFAVPTDILPVIPNPAQNSILIRIPLKAIFPSTAVVKPKEIPETAPPHALTSNIVMEEQKKVQRVMTDLMNDFKKLQQKVSQQGLKKSSLYEAIVEMVGPEAFVPVLQNNKSLCLTHFLKDNNWAALFREILDNLGVRKFVFWLIRTPKLTLINLLDAFCEQMPNEDVEAQKFAQRLMEISLSLSGALKPDDIQSIFSKLFQICQISKFSTEEILQFATFKLSPSIRDSIPSFRHINVIQLDNKALQCPNAIRNDLNNFVEKLTTAVEESELPTIFPKNKLVVMYNYDEHTDRICASKSNEVIIKSITKLLESLPREELTEDQTKSIVYAMFSKVPYDKFSRYLNTRFVNMPPL